MQHAAPSPFPPGLPRALDASEFGAIVARCGERRHACTVLDLRGADKGQPCAPSVRGSAWVPFDARGRLPVALLPARGRPLALIGPRAEQVAEGMTEAGWPTWWFEGELRTSWLQPDAPTGALWDIDPHLRARLADLPHPDTGPVLDLGCGSSREGVFLAQAGYRVLAIDRLADALELARRRAAHHRVALQTQLLRVGRDVELPAGPFAAVLMFRFLERAVLPTLGRRMATGGLVLLRTFGQGAAGGALPVTGAKGPRRESRRIVPEQVAELLGRGWSFVDGPRAELEGDALWTVAAARWEGR